jgi:hypothetical protein
MRPAKNYFPARENISIRNSKNLLIDIENAEYTVGLALKKKFRIRATGLGS